MYIYIYIHIYIVYIHKILQKCNISVLGCTIARYSPTLGVDSKSCPKIIRTAILEKKIHERSLAEITNAFSKTFKRHL